MTLKPPTGPNTPLSFLEIAAGTGNPTQAGTTGDLYWREDAPTQGSRFFLNTGGSTWVPIDGPQFNVLTFGAKGDGATDDTAAIQRALDAAYTAGGGTVYFPTGNYVASTLTYRTDSGATPKGLQILGAGRYATKISQKAGTADLLLKCGDLTTRHQFCSIRHIAFNGFASQATSAGLITLEGTADSDVRYNAFSYFNNQAVQIKGGIADGDAMYNLIETNHFQQPLAGAVFVRLTSASSGVGSHPDATNILGNHMLGLGAGTAGTGIKVEKATVNGALAADAAFIAFNRMTEVATPVNIEGGQAARVIANRFEVVQAPTTMTILVQNGSAWTSVVGTVFAFNEYATAGVPGNLTFTDTSSDGALRIGEMPSTAATSSFPPGLLLPDTSATAAKGLTLSDIHLFRAAAGTAAVDAAIRANSWLRAQQGTTNQVTVGLNSGGAASPEIVFGSSNDTGLKRSAAASLPTLASNNAFTLRAYTTGTLPVATNFPDGSIVYVSDGAAGAKFQGTAGGAWVNLG